MATQTLSTRPDSPDRQLGLNLWLNGHTDITVNATSVGASLRIGGADGPRLDLHADPACTGLSPGRALDLIENLLCRGLTAVTEARQTMFLDQLRQLDCEGRCHPATWTKADTWVCSATDTGRAHSCSLEEGHDGDHLACTVHGHKAYTWPRGAQQ